MSEQQNHHSPELSHQVEKGLLRLIETIPLGSTVALEGSPIYLNTPWGVEDEYLTNTVLGYIFQQLQDKSCHIHHFVLLDDLTIDEPIFDPSHYLEQMQIQPDNVRFESEFNNPALINIASMQRQENVRSNPGRIILQEGSQPNLITRSNRPSCAILDALFQSTKDCGFNIIIHPKQFRGQQEDMRTVLREINNGQIPFITINIFFKNSNISQILITDQSGESHALPV